MISLTNRLQIMGVLYSHGRPDISKVVDQAASMVSEGVDWLDVGGESTRPGAKSISLEEELNRVIPVIEALSRRFSTKISVDTSQSKVITLAASAGASMVNDVRALRLEGALMAAVNSGIAVCLMHMQGNPESMQNKPDYGFVVEDIYEFLHNRIQAVIEAGIPKKAVCIDPGFGFGKSLQHNLEILNSLSRFKALGVPLLVGFSRKSMIGLLTGRESDKRDNGTTVFNTLALNQGANIFRVHNVADAIDMVKICSAVQNVLSKYEQDKITE